MFHLVDNFQDKSGNALAGYYVKLKVPGGAYATLYADESGTPIVSVSGVANTAVTDSNGMYSLYVAEDKYEIEFFDKNDINQRILMIPSVPMYANTSASTALGRLAATTAGEGAALVSMEGGGTAQAAIVDRPTSAVLAATGGADLIGAQRPGTTWAQPKTALDYLLDHATSITECGAVQDFDHAAGTGTDNSTTNFANMLADTKVGSIFIPPGEKGFKFGSSIQLRDNQSLVGFPAPMTHSSAKTTPISKLAFRPTGTDKVLIRNNGALSACGVQDVALDLNDATHTGIQFNTTYSPKILNVSLFGTMNWGVVLHDVYVAKLDGLYAGGLALFKAGAIFLGDHNGTRIRDVHLSALPIAAADRVYGLCANGLGGDLIVEEFLAQGQTVGVYIGPNNSAVELKVYNENTVCPIILGEPGGVVGPQGVTIRPSVIAGPNDSHSQYASRGPMIYLRGGRGIKIEPQYIATTAPAPASATGPWHFLVGSSLADVTIDKPSLFAGGGDVGAAFMLDDAGNSPGYLLNGIGAGHNEWVQWRKKAGAFGATGYATHLDVAGAWVATAYTPATIGSAPAALLTAAAPTSASVLL